LLFLVFALATVWKLALGEYVNGDFLEWTLLTDGRLSRITLAISDLRRDDLTLVREVLGRLMSVGTDGSAIALPRSPAVSRTAVGLSWSILFLEGCIAVVHAIPWRSLRVVRHALLITFVLTAYTIVPVAGFSLVLSAMGVAQCEQGEGRALTVYMLLVGCTQLQLLPWQATTL
jgi:hypothetical protein